MITNAHINFPSQAVSDLEKLSEEYGLEVAKAIRQEWFTGATSKYDDNINNYHQLKHLSTYPNLIFLNPKLKIVFLNLVDTVPEKNNTTLPFAMLYHNSFFYKSWT